MLADDASWLKDMRKEQASQQDDFQVQLGRMRQHLKGMTNWRAPGTDQVHAFWIKNLKSLHERFAHHLQVCVITGQLPQWMTTERTVLLVKNEEKGTLASNFRPIAYLPITYKLLTGMMAQVIYEHLDQSNELPVEQKGCSNNTRGTKDQLLIHKTVLHNCKRRKTNLNVA